MISPVKIFFCYAREDEALLNKLKTHLRPLQLQGLIEMWHDRDISAGTEWEQEISKQLNEADIILLLVSPDFMNSDYCYGIEMKRAMERHDRGEARVIPIILRSVNWEGASFSKLHVLPTGARPVIGRSWRNKDEAFADVAQGIHKVIKEFNSHSFETKQKTQQAQSEEPLSSNTTASDTSSNTSPNTINWREIPNALRLVDQGRVVKQLIRLRQKYATNSTEEIYLLLNPKEVGEATKAQFSAQARKLELLRSLFFLLPLIVTVLCITIAISAYMQSKTASDPLVYKATFFDLWVMGFPTISTVHLNIDFLQLTIPLQVNHRRYFTLNDMFFCDFLILCNAMLVHFWAHRIKDYAHKQAISLSIWLGQEIEQLIESKIQVNNSD